MSAYEPIVFPDRAARQTMFGHPNPETPTALPSPGTDLSRPGRTAQGQAAPAGSSHMSPMGFETCDPAARGNTINAPAFNDGPWHDPAPAGPLHNFAGVPVAAMEDVMAERSRQIIGYGHTPEDDLTLRLEVLPARMRAMAMHAYEDCTMFRPYTLTAECLADKRQRIAMARKRMVQATALGLAAIDRIDAELAAMDAAAQSQSDQEKLL